MIGIFPDPYPDEIFYSICARLCERLGYPSHRATMQELFGCEAVIASMIFPSHLDYFVAQLPLGTQYTPEYFLEAHTLLPFYAPFLPPERVQHLRKDMCGQNGPALHMRSGIMASRVSLPEFLRFCPQCIAEDKKLFGECYWHRIHQVSGVEICPIHDVYLHASNVPARNKKTRHEFISAEKAIQGIIPNEGSLHNAYHYTLLNIARDAYWLLRQHNISQAADLKLLSSRYRRLLAQADLATYRGRVDIGMFLQKFLKLYPPPLLRMLHCEIEEHINENWLLRLVRMSDGAQHPLHHLLLIHFLGYTAESFFSLSPESKPFGEGPWPCLNPVCDYYRQPHIKACQTIYSQHISGRPVGIFACTCGFIYSRTGPDTTEGDQFILSRIKSFGFVWETKLQRLWEDEAASLREIARQLNVDPLTVKRHVARLGLPLPRSVGNSSWLRVDQQLRSSVPGKLKETTIESYRATWLATIQAHPGAGTKMLRDKAPGVYMWLYKNDQAWLKTHRCVRKKELSSTPQRVNWGERDAQLAEEVKVAALHLKNLPQCPIHLTIASIGREIGQLALLQQHLDKLPETANSLSELVESHEEFAIRKVKWTAQVHQQEGIYLQRWQLIRKAGIERRAKRPKVKEAIEEVMQTLRII